MSHVALTKCFYCGKDDTILLATRYWPDGKPVLDLSEMHGKVVSMDPCNECRGYMDKGVILLTIDSAKSENNWNESPYKGCYLPPEKRVYWMPNPHRTGGYFVLTDEAIKRIIHPTELADYAIRTRWMFIEHQAAEMMGLFQQVTE